MAHLDESQLSTKRRIRINRLKRFIVAFGVVLAAIPLVLCVFLGIRLHRMSGELEATEEEKAALKEQMTTLANTSEIPDTSASADALSGNPNRIIDYDVAEDSGMMQDAASVDGQTHVYLTFDDGPSPNTAAILDLLEEYDVKATFFVVGNTDAYAKDIYRRIVDEGHSIGIHSFSHRYQEIYASEEAFLTDFYMLSDYVYDITGARPTICRLPGGSSNTVSNLDIPELIKDLNRQGIRCYDWNISGRDAEGNDLSSEEIARNVLEGVDRFQTAIVLLHDSGDKKATVEALRIVLDGLRERENVVIEPVTADTPIILHIAMDTDA
ncbi:MAG: polysaccharide deacetylase [Lachnospiraceae bacterium]|nr:polysaccharide deacetylase [Lachnospiraceae bacterium]